MKDNNKDLTQDKQVDIDHLIQSLYGFSDEQLLKEFEEAEQDETSDPNIQVYPDEFDRIWEDICAERAACAQGNTESTEEAGTIIEAETIIETETIKEPVRKKRLSWKKITVFALAAAFLTASFCFVAVGKKSYFYRMLDRGNSNSNIVFNNDTDVMILDDQEGAYELIEEYLKIKPFRLGYLPEGMYFDSLEINDRRAIMTFMYNNKTIYFVQATDQTEVSNNYKTDGKAYKSIKNIQLNNEILVKKEEDDMGRVVFGTQFVYKESYCWLYGEIDEDNFVKMVERITN